MHNDKTRLQIHPSREYFEAHSTDWEALRKSYYSDEVATRVLGLAKDGKLLDVGCGTGFLLLRALDDKRFSKVYGVDFSHSMIERLKDAAWGKRAPSLRLADATRLPFPNDTFDSVVSNMFLHHLKYPAAGVFEMARVLKPGGRFVLADLRPHDHAWFQQELADVWLGFDEKDLREWMDDAGVGNVKIGADVETEVTIRQEARAPVRIFVAEGEKRA